MLSSKLEFRFFALPEHSMYRARPMHIHAKEPCPGPGPGLALGPRPTPSPKLSPEALRKFNIGRKWYFFTWTRNEGLDAPPPANHS